MLSPLTSQNFRRVARIVWLESWSALDIKTQSSAKKRYDNLGPLPAILIGFQVLSSIALCIAFERSSIHNKYMYGEIGPPCRMPLDGLKKSVLEPLTRIATLLNGRKVSERKYECILQ